MRITIINGVPNENFGAHEKAIVNAVENLKSSHDVDFFVVRDMDIQYCIGCFGCWVKNPGRCVHKDDMSKILASLAKTDFALYISPLSAGFISRHTKNVLDRSIPVLLPYIKIYGGECHHPKRYGNQVDTGIIILDDGKLDAEAVDITFEAFDRNGLNMHTDIVLKRTATSEEMAGIFDEINRH